MEMILRFVNDTYFHIPKMNTLLCFHFNKEDAMNDNKDLLYYQNESFMKF